MNRANIITNVALGLACIGAVYVASEAQQALDDMKAKWRPAAPALRGSIQPEQLGRDARNLERSPVSTSSPPARTCTAVSIDGGRSGSTICFTPGERGSTCANDPQVALTLKVELCQ